VFLAAPIVHYGRYSYGLISFSVTDDTGNLLYPDGIEATWKVGDDFRHAYGDPEAPLIQAALGYVESGRCTAENESKKLIAQRGGYRSG
jgi:hypothetical protein